MAAHTTFRHGAVPKIGVLITNLGTPQAPTPQALRKYLAEFLWDPRVVEIPRPIWWLILHGIILRTRPAKSAHAYQTVWREDGAPLLVFSQQLVAGIRRRLNERVPGPTDVRLAMRYGQPSIRTELEALRQAGCERLLVLPLYPQYSGATTGSTFDAVVDRLRRWRWVPEFRMINHYHDDPRYIEAVANKIRAYWQEHGHGQLLLFSFHGMPKHTLLKGDPYHCQCQKTARLVAEQLKLGQDQWRVVFQSRFGKAEWLKPYAIDTLRKLPKEGVTRVDVVCPGFAADCLETLEEMAVQNRGEFMAAGGAAYRYIPALNDDREHVDMLASLIEEHIQGWPEAASGFDLQRAEQEGAQSQRRAQEMGAP